MDPNDKFHNKFSSFPFLSCYSNSGNDLISLHFLLENLSQGIQTPLKKKRKKESRYTLTKNAKSCWVQMIKWHRFQSSNKYIYTRFLFASKSLLSKASPRV